MLIGRRYRLALTPEQVDYAERVAGICRAVWNTGLEQRREYRRRGGFIGYAGQCRQLTEAKVDEPWLKEAPAHVLQQTLRDLDRACDRHGAHRVHWRSARGSRPSFRFPDRNRIKVKRLNRRWAAVYLERTGWLRFRRTRPIGGEIRSATVLKDGGNWYVSFCIEDGLLEASPNGQPAVGVDRGVKVSVAYSDGTFRDRKFATAGETERLKRLRRKLSRQKKGSGRRNVTRAQLVRLNARIRTRREDFTAWTANRLTRDHGLIAVEDLKIRNMTKSARGTVAEPGKNVRQKAGLNRAILDKGWGGLLLKLEHKARYNGSVIVRVPAAYTSQTCNACGHVAAESRESQARFRCVACKHQDNADVNAAKNILAAGLAVTGRGDLGVTRSVKRQPAAIVQAA